MFLDIPRPCPRPVPRPTHRPDGPLLKIGGGKRGPIQGMSAGRPRTGAGRRLRQKNTPRPGGGAGPDQ